MEFEVRQNYFSFRTVYYLLEPAYDSFPLKGTKNTIVSCTLHPPDTG